LRPAELAARLGWAQRLGRDSTGRARPGTGDHTTAGRIVALRARSGSPAAVGRPARWSSYRGTGRPWLRADRYHSTDWPWRDRLDPAGLRPRSFPHWAAAGSERAI